jgi:hypothetical protein
MHLGTLAHARADAPVCRSMLHIHNGDASANIARQSSLPGEHFAFREALIEGPTSAHKDNDGDWLVRARHLWSAYGVDLKESAQGLLAQEQKLASFGQHDEVVLWFEHDLFCQINLIYLLDWFASRELGETKLSLICIDRFAGRENFRGLGELTSDELASLFPERKQVTQQQFDLSTATWTAYCSDNPTDLERLLKTDCSSLPFLSKALGIHLQRFPSIKNGLGRIENTALSLLNAGAISFAELFPRFAKIEALYGFGDTQLWFALRRMHQVRHPMFTISGDAEMQKEISAATVFEMTAAGEAVLSAENDFVVLNGIENWLGGVHLSGKKNLWRWDDERKTLILT